MVLLRWERKKVYVIPCEEQSSNLFPLVGQEPKQGTQMDRGEAEVEEERQAKVKSAPVLPTDRERSTRSRMRRFADGARRVWQDVRQKIPTNAQQLNRQCHLWPWITESSDVTRTWSWPRSWC